MARLIDADALRKGYQDHERISTHIIWNAPTVEAIPIEWLEQIAEKIPSATIEIDIPHNLLVFTSKRFVEVLTELWRRHFSPDQIADGEWIRRQKDE